MLPLLRDGDTALVRPLGDTMPAVGDVICYETPPTGLRLHRVIERSPDGVVAKGDALGYVEHVARAHILGSVVAVQRRGRITWLDGWLARWCGRAAAALSPVIPCALAIALRVWRLAEVTRRG